MNFRENPEISILKELNRSKTTFNSVKLKKMDI